jgi:hypothetical protein
VNGGLLDPFVGAHLFALGHSSLARMPQKELMEPELGADPLWKF